ncbi:Proton/peptide symporter family protein [Capnocytophaga cynodegmi]|uniref:Proton/peptide symporter family protein n=3 Tax=Capnocytophaga cynodegmi TaxID=28189 RepID=A0A0B7HMI8_9FLAO|nr:Proton/peptide symporter family protein [Capnocytophaga cynodegmi]
MFHCKTKTKKNMSQQKTNFFDTQVLGHPAGLFVLFFTEMWERFSFYGMRVLLVNFLTMALIGYNPGWEWTTENAGALFGTYVMLLYLTPIVGGTIADRFIGYRWAIVIGAIIMTLGHAAMALETEFWLYVGLGLLVIGTGFFKPNMTSIISHMYKDLPEKKDGAYTIFYMGVNAGAFFGMMLCGYMAEKVGWSWGFGLAGIFMLIGTLQFWLARPLFGSIGDVPSKNKQEITKTNQNKPISDEDKPNPFTLLDKILIGIAAIIGLGYAINDPLSRIGGIDLFSFLETTNIKGQYIAVIFGLIAFFFVIISRLTRYTKIVRERMITVIIFAFFTVFFWLSFEQGASSLILFARDNVQRELLDNQAIIFNIVNALLTIIPLALITYVLFILAKKTFSKILASNIVLLICFGLVWVIVGWMLQRDFKTVAYNVSYEAFEVYESDGKNLKVKEDGSYAVKYIPITIDNSISVTEENSIQKTEKVFKITENNAEGKNIVKYLPYNEHKKPKGNFEIIENTIKTIALPRVDNKTGKQATDKDGNMLFDFYVPSKNNELSVVNRETIIGEGDNHFNRGEEILILTKDNKFSSFGYADMKKAAWARERAEQLNTNNGLIKATVKEEKANWVEITTSWFSILNSFFIIALANVFSRIWDSRYNPPAAVKYGMGLIIMAIGFGLLAFGANGVGSGVKVSMLWLVVAYLFHTMGELCMAPVGLSYVSKLVPARMIAFMFGVWYLAIAIGNKLAAILGGQIENITEKYNLSTFFLIFTIVPIVAGLIIIFISPLVKKLMHGVK